MPVIGSRVLIVLLAGLTTFGPLSIDLYLPSLPEIAQALGARQAEIQLTIGVFLGGISLGMLIYGPLSDRFGRRPLLLGGLVLYVAASLGCAFAVDAWQLTLLRLLQALGAAAATVLARVIMRDVFPIAQAARILSLMHLITMVATLVAPVLGGYLLLLASWRWLFVALASYALICLLCVYLAIPETHPTTSRDASIGRAFRAYGQLLGSPRALGLILCMGLAFAGMFAYITASPFVYIQLFGVSPQHYGWLFALNIGGVITVTLANARWVGRCGPQRLLRVGVTVVSLAGVALALSGLLRISSLPILVLGVFCYVSVTGLIGANCLASLLAQFPRHAGAAAGLAVATQFGLGMLASAAVGLWHDGTALPMTAILSLAGVGSALVYRIAHAKHAVDAV